jgi:hypothetical protein
MIISKNNEWARYVASIGEKRLMDIQNAGR